MRFTTASILIQVLALGYVSAQEAEKGPHNQVCGIKNVSDATLADCETLLNEDEVWTEATSQTFESTESLGDPVKIACYEKCCLFHRWEKWSNTGFKVDEIRLEAATLLACASTENGLVNGRVSYGLFDETKEDNTRHTLCIGGDIKQGPDCFTDLIKKEAEEDEQRAKEESI